MNDDQVESDFVDVLKGGKSLMAVYDNEPTESDWEIFWKAVPMGILFLIFVGAMICGAIQAVMQ